ncbi:EXD1-like protein [Mya arenaria]|uniref:EXD1-like protein n=1 Tax=Mya arenaria TaxID=6604 RepID=A0ABY7FYG0_MYAAR|nr:EXD1-like protein [Mya arenaria]
MEYDSNIVNAAEGEDAEYHFIGEEEHWQVCLDAIKQAVSKGQMCALNCKGESLSRKGSIKLLSTQERYFILDIQKLNALPFERGLREILEDRNVMKLMFDCREDADALFHQFHVKLDGVIDIQLLEVLKRPVFVGKTINRKTGDHTLGAICLNSLLECIQTYVKSDKIDEQKEDGMELKKESVKRHLSDEQIQYVKTDVMSLFSLFDFFYPNDEEIKRLKIASHIYVDLKRSITNSKTTSIFQLTGIVSCTACHRFFPRDAFSNKQLKKHKHMCKTCKKVKNDMDVRRVRLKNYEKKEREEVVRKYTFGPCEERELGEHLYEICDRKDEYERLENGEELRENQYEFCDDCSDSYDENGRVEINKQKDEYTYAFYESYCERNDEYDRLERKEK